MRLDGGGSKAAFSCCCILARRGPRIDSAASAVVAHASVRSNDYVSAIGIVDYAGVDAVHFCVVEERAASPVAAVVANATVAEAVINAAIKSNVRPPVACVPGVDALAPAPIPGRPKQPYAWRNDPSPWDPVVALIAPNI